MSLALIAYALGLPAAPAVRRPAAAPRWPAAAIKNAAKQAAGAKVEAAGRALLAAQAKAAETRSVLLRASMDHLVNLSRSGAIAHERRLAKADAERRAEAASRTLQARQAEFNAAVREFYSAT
jgi:hypothetical protein